MAHLLVHPECRWWALKPHGALAAARSQATHPWAASPRPRRALVSLQSAVAARTQQDHQGAAVYRSQPSTSNAGVVALRTSMVGPQRLRPC